jgi:arylformamidase
VLHPSRRLLHTPLPEPLPLSRSDTAAIIRALMRILDISQPLGRRTAVWPGDRNVDVSWSLQRAHGDAVNVAALLTSVHAGTHVDGFLHVTDDGEAAGEMPVDAYIGPCTVLDVRGREALTVDDVAGVDLTRAQRVLFRTRDVVDETRFPERFTHIEPSLARRLADSGIRLVGTDAPSVDPVESKTLDTHHVLAAGRVAILENVVLTDVVSGEYLLVALPLRLVEADSSPVRAVLIAEWGAAGGGGLS